MVNKYLSKLGKMETDHKRILDKLAGEHNTKIKTDEKKYIDL